MGIRHDNIWDDHKNFSEFTAIPDPSVRPRLSKADRGLLWLVRRLFAGIRVW